MLGVCLQIQQWSSNVGTVFADTTVNVLLWGCVCRYNQRVLGNVQAVTCEDVLRVLRQYLIQVQGSCLRLIDLCITQF